jgi:hypothetical protein
VALHRFFNGAVRSLFQRPVMFVHPSGYVC